MSYAAVDWAMAQVLTPSARKFLLVALAHHTNSQGGACYPSIARLAETTALDRKTVIAHLSALETAGFIADTGQRHGTTKQVKEYRLSMSNKAEQSPNEQSQYRNGSESGTVPLFPSNSTVFPSKESQKRDTEQGSEQGREQEMADRPPVSSKAAGLCPHQEIIDLYHEALPNNPKCKVLTAARKATIKARWNEASKLTCKPFGYTTRDDGLNAWRAFFDICADSDFLTGKAPGTNGRPSFVAGIDFLMSASGFAKTLENHYHREAAA